MVDHDIMRFDVAMHDSPRMAEVERFEEFVDVVSYVVVGESRVENFKIGVVDIFEDDGGSFGLLYRNASVSRSYSVYSMTVC